MNKITIGGKTIEVEGNNISIQDDKLYVDGVLVDLDQEGGLVKFASNGILKIKWEGDTLANLKTDKNVECENVAGNVDAGGSIRCGTVSGSVTCEGSVNCEDVGEGVKAGGSVNCGDVKGNVKAGGSICCNNVKGDVSSGGSIKTYKRQGY